MVLTHPAIPEGVNMKRSTRYGLLSLLAITTAAGFASAGPAPVPTVPMNAKSTAEQRDEVSITVYNQNFGLVREVRTMDLPPGRTALEFADVSQQIQPETVSIKALTGNLHVLEQNYRYDLLSPQKLLEKYVGKKVKVYRWNQATGKEDPFDAEVLSSVPERIALTIDSYVVQPWRFPGGDIGRLAVSGTVNDLAMAGAEPKALSCAFILEEGLPIETLRKVVESMRRAAAEAGVEIVTGDTKVVDAGKGDQLFVNTSGVGSVTHPLDIRPVSVKSGDAVLVSGDLGRHGVAILAVREGLAFETEIVSDCASLWPSVKALLDSGVEVHCLRDLTRGGLVSTLNEIARDSKTQTVIEETAVPVLPAVASACELLGLDPMSVANEGRFAIYVPEAQAEKALQALRSVPVSSGAVRIGRVGSVAPGFSPRVLLRTALGSERLLDMLSGEQLPRIC